jgi:hypothetical protein
MRIGVPARIRVYTTLMDLQGTVITRFFGIGSFYSLIPPRGSWHYFSWTRLYQNCVNEEKWRPPLEKVLRAFTEHMAVYWGSKVDNFMFCEDGIVMIIDLQEVTFPVNLQPWEIKINLANATSLVTYFRDIRNRIRLRSDLMWEQ